MFAAIKRFFAPSSAFFSWLEIKHIILSATQLSRRVFWEYFSVFWWMFVLTFASVVFVLVKSGFTKESTDVTGAILDWVEGSGVLGLVSLVVGIFVLAMVYLSQFFFVRAQPSEVITSRVLWSKICKHYQFVLLQPLVFMGYWFFSVIGDFYTLIFLDSTPSWSSLARSFWSGIKLGIKLLPLRLGIYFVAWLVAMASITCVIVAGAGIFWIATLSTIAAWCLGAPFVIALLVCFLWSFPRCVFFALAVHSIVYDKVRARFPELFESSRS